MGHHIRIEQPQIGGLLPFVTRHLVEHGGLTVDDLIVAQRKDEVLVIIIRHGEGELVLAASAEQGVELEEVEGVVHPAHHPFHAETEAVGEGWAAYAGPVGGLFGNRLDIWKIAEKGLVEILYKIDRLEVSIAAVFVGFPLPLLP